jgi:glycosyltransferase involved in cell wall biosynthesis
MNIQHNSPPTQAGDTSIGQSNPENIGAQPRLLYLRQRDDDESPYRRHEMLESTHPRHYSDFLGEISAIDWLPRNPHSLSPNDLWKNLRKASGQYDGYFANASSLLVLAANVGGLRSVPYYMLYWGNSSQSRVRNLVIRLNLLLARRILVNDRDSLDELVVEWGLPQSKVTWLPLPVDTDYYHPCDEMASDYLLVPGDTKRDEGFVCEVAKQGKWPIMRSVKQSPTAVCYKAQPTSLMRMLTLKQWAAFSEIRRNTQRARAVLLPLEDKPEPLGLTALLESMACGRPVIISEGRAARDHIVHGVTGFVMRGPRETWLRQLADVLKDARLLETVGAKARRYAVETHSFPAVRRAWCEVFE